MHDDPELLVLHMLRVAGVVETEVLAARLSSGASELEPVLGQYEQAGLVVRYRGALPGWSLTTLGRTVGEQLLARELEEYGARPLVEDAYGRFLELNGDILGVCANWQVVAGPGPDRLNDHTDAVYDREVLDRLGLLHDRASELLAVIAGTLARFSGYRDRLSNALARARSGGVDWVTRPVIDSYHTVWFELHEDLLATLGRSRNEERGPDRNDTARVDRAQTGRT